MYYGLYFLCSGCPMSMILVYVSTSSDEFKSGLPREIFKLHTFSTFDNFYGFLAVFYLFPVAGYIWYVYKVYMSRWCRLHFLSLWNNKDIKSRSKLCTVFIKNTLTSLFVSNQNEKPHAEKKREKKTQCWPEILLERLIDNVYICIWKSILRRGRLFQIYHICEIFQGTFHLGLVFAKLLILNICISSILGSHARGREGGGKLVWNEQNFFPTANPPMFSQTPALHFLLLS